MGADGRIDILDLDKMVGDLQVSEGTLSIFLEAIKDSVTYERKILGRRVLTVYRGDNLYVCPIIEEIASFGFQKGKWEEPWGYDQVVKILRDVDRDVIIDMAVYLMSKCVLDRWEVWT